VFSECCELKHSMKLSTGGPVLCNTFKLLKERKVSSHIIRLPANMYTVGSRLDLNRTVFTFELFRFNMHGVKCQARARVIGA
jgi:hypothetical protein